MVACLDYDPMARGCIITTKAAVNALDFEDFVTVVVPFWVRT